MADTKISNLSAITALAGTELLAVVDSAGVSQKKATLSQIRGDGFFYARDYGSNGAAIQSAIDLAVAAGGGWVIVGPGTWALGTTSLTIGGHGVRIIGAGKEATLLTYTGSTGAIKNSNPATTERRYCGVSDLSIDVSGGSGSATPLHIFNFYRGNWERLQLKCGATSFDGLRLEGDGTTSTYYNTFRDIDISSNGICVHFTGTGPINRNTFWGGLWEGTGKALVFDCTTGTCDTNNFYDHTITCSHATEVMAMGGNGGAVLYSAFVNWKFETGTSAAITMATASGIAANNYFLGGIYGNITIATQDNMDNHVWIPSQLGLDYMKIAGNGSDGESMWFERDNGGMTFGSGKDVNLYRGGSNQLKTDDSLLVGGDILAAKFAAGSASAGSWPKLQVGTLLTTPEDGAIEIDATNIYGTTDAGNRGYIPVRHFIRASAAQTLTSQTAAQGIFDSPANGRITLETGVYRFEMMLEVTGMSATSGNAQILFGGTGTFGDWLWMVRGLDNTTPTTINAGLEAFLVSNASAASVVTAGTGTALRLYASGTFECSAAGTLIPQIALVTAAGATVVAGSFFLVERMCASGSVNSLGQWD